MILCHLFYPLPLTPICGGNPVVTEDTNYYLIILCSDEEGVGGSGDDYLKVDSAWHGDIDSDADSVDSEEEDPLK